MTRARIAVAAISRAWCSLAVWAQAPATLKIPNACTSGHTDKSNAWASETLKSWPEFSPWRVGP